MLGKSMLELEEEKDAEQGKGTEETATAAAGTTERKWSRCYKQKQLQKQLIDLEVQINLVVEQMNGNASNHHPRRPAQLETELQRLHGRRRNLKNEIAALEEGRLRQQRFRARKREESATSLIVYSQSASTMSTSVVTTTETSSPKRRKVGSRERVALSVPLNSSLSEVENLDCKQWQELKNVYPILRSCPWIENSSLDSFETQLCEEQQFKEELAVKVSSFVQKIQRSFPMIANTADYGFIMGSYGILDEYSKEAIREINDFVNLRRLFLMLSIHHGRDAARRLVVKRCILYQSRNKTI